jgi:hypothetical protein
MTSNLDKILSDLNNRTSEDIKRIEKASHEKQEALMKHRPYL